MTPTRRTYLMPRLLTAAAGTALALSLAACGGPGADKPTEDTQSEAAESPEGGFGGGSVETTPAESPGSEPAEAEPTDTESTDPFADAAKTTNWASDDGMKIDKDGNGTVPASSIEADLVDLFENKLELKLKEAKCDSDMELREWYGFEVLPGHRQGQRGLQGRAEVLRDGEDRRPQRSDDQVRTHVPRHRQGRLRLQGLTRSDSSRHHPDATPSPSLGGDGVSVPRLRIDLPAAVGTE